MVFINPYNLTYTSMYTTDTTSNLFRADIMAYLNILGAIYVLIHSIFLRRMLVSMSGELDKAEVSPQDYGLVVRDIPKETTPDSLKVQIEKQFNDEVKVAYVNYCYDITEMLALGEKIEGFSKDLAHYRLYLKKELKSRHLSKQMFLNDINQVPQPEVKRGLCKSETLDIKTLNTSLMDSFEEISHYGKNLEPGKNDELFSGIAIVVVETQKMQELILNRSAIRDACCGGSGANTGFSYERAPEPSDIYWENLAVTSFGRRIRVTLTFIATFLLVGACFGILYAISLANDQLLK